MRQIAALLVLALCAVAPAFAQTTGNLPLVGTYAISMVSNNGRGAALLTSPAVSTEVLWVVGGFKAVGLDVDSANTGPTLLTFEQ